MDMSLSKLWEIVKDREAWSFAVQFSTIQLLSHVWLFATSWTVAHQAPLSMGFSRQEYWNRLPFTSPGDLPTQQSNLHLLHWPAVLYHWVIREAQIWHIKAYIRNLEKWYRWTYFQGRKADDIQNGHVDTAGEGEGGINRESSITIHILLLLLLSRFSRIRLCATP